MSKLGWEAVATGGDSEVMHMAGKPSWVSAARFAITLGTVVSLGVIGWVMNSGATHTAGWVLLGFGGVLLTLGVAYLSLRAKLYEFVVGEGRGLAAVTAVGLMLAVGVQADPGGGRFVDRILVWAFVVFTVGLSELFLLFVVAAILGRIDLSQAFMDKSLEAPRAPLRKVATNATDADAPAAGEAESAASGVSLSRMQAFAWTLVVMIVYFHRVVTNRSGELPTIPAELLMVMGISGAVYLTSKQMRSNAEVELAKMPKRTSETVVDPKAGTSGSGPGAPPAAGPSAQPPPSDAPPVVSPSAVPPSAVPPSAVPPSAVPPSAAPPSASAAPPSASSAPRTPGTKPDP